MAMTSRTSRTGRKLLSVITSAATEVAATGDGRFCDPAQTQLITNNFTWGVGLESVREEVFSLPDEDGNECVHMMMNYLLWARGKAVSPSLVDEMQEYCIAAVDKMKDSIRFNPTLDGTICRFNFGDERMNPLPIQLDPLEVTCTCLVTCHCSIKEPFPGDYFCEPLE